MQRIIVAGYMIRMPVAGMVLAFAQYLRGLQLLGCDVLYIEESGWSESCYDPLSGCYTSSPEVGMTLVRQLLEKIDCSCPLAYVDSEKQIGFGLDRREVEDAVMSADLVINVGGVNWLDDFNHSKRLVLIDLDPMFTQAGSFAKESMGKYVAYFTYGTNVGQQDCLVPTAGVQWIPTVPPVIPELWDNVPAKVDNHHFSTIANWTAYGGIEWEGEHYGQKDEEFLKLIDLPKRVPAQLQIAATGMPAKVASQFRDHGWEITDGQQVSLCLEDYMELICKSSGEFSVAKNGYVKARTGWISDRSVCYLAAGRPAVVQETDVSGHVSKHPGWTPFTGLDEAATVIQRILASYDEHQSQARSMAREVFGYQVVLPRLLDMAFESKP